MFNSTIDWENVDEAKKVLSEAIKQRITNMNTPLLNYDELHNELYDYYNVKIQDNLDTQQINELLTYLQNLRSRVAYINVQSFRDYKTKKSTLDFFTLIVVQYADSTKYKNKESREGFVIERLADLFLDVQVAEFLKDNAESCLKNLNDLLSIVSRQISVLQIELQLGQIARPGNSSGLPSDNISNDATWHSDENFEKSLEINEQDENEEIDLDF